MPCSSPSVVLGLCAMSRTYHSATATPARRSDQAGLGSATMELPGPWVAAEANDDIRRNGDRARPGRSRVERDRRAGALAAAREVRFERRPGPVPHELPRARTGRRTSPLGHVRRRVVPGRRLARRCLSRRSRGLLLRPTASTSPISAGSTTNTFSPSRSPARRSATSAIAATSPVCSSSRNGSTGRSTRGAVAPVRLYDTGPVRIDRLRVLCRDADPRRAHLRIAGRPRQRRPATDRDPHAGRRRAPRRDHARGGEWRQRARVEPRIGRPDVVVAAFARRPAADHGHRRGPRRRRVERPPATGGPGCAGEWDDWVCSINGERIFLKGANLLPTSSDLADADPAATRADIESAIDLGLDVAARARPRGPSPQLRRRRRTRRAAAAGLPTAVEVCPFRPVAGGRPGAGAVDSLGHHPSIVSWSAHDDPRSRRSGPAGTPGRPTGCAVRCARRPASNSRRGTSRSSTGG